MTAPSTDPDRPHYVDWPISTEADHKYLGTITASGAPVFYAPDTRSAAHGDVDEEAKRLVPAEEAEWEMNPEESLGEFLERIGDEVGWDHLSEFAREHLESDGEER